MFNYRYLICFRVTSFRLCSKTYDNNIVIIRCVTGFVYLYIFVYKNNKKRGFMSFVNRCLVFDLIRRRIKVKIINLKRCRHLWGRSVSHSKIYIRTLCNIYSILINCLLVYPPLYLWYCNINFLTPHHYVLYCRLPRELELCITYFYTHMSFRQLGFIILCIQYTFTRNFVQTIKIRYCSFRAVRSNCCNQRLFLHCT